MEYYGLDVHKLSITYTCMTEEGKGAAAGACSHHP